MRRTLLALVFLGIAVPAWAARAVVDWQYDYVNVRARPGTDETLVGRLSTGAEAEVLERVSESGEEWVRVRYTGGGGWVVARSLRDLPEPAPSTDVSTEAPPAGDEEPDEPPKAAAEAPLESDRESLPSRPPAPQEEPSGGYLSQYTERADLPEVDATSGIVNMISGLLLVLALFAGAVFLYRRFLGPRLPGGRSGAGIQVLASRSTGQRQGLLLVESGGLVWLLGQGPDGLRLIAEIQDPKALARLNDRYGFLASPFEAELRHRMDLETEPTERHGETTAEFRAAEPSPEERLAELRRRPNPDQRS